MRLSNVLLYNEEMALAAPILTIPGKMQDDPPANRHSSTTLMMSFQKLRWLPCRWMGRAHTTVTFQNEYSHGAQVAAIWS